MSETTDLLGHDDYLDVEEYENFLYWMDFLNARIYTETEQRSDLDLGSDDPVKREAAGDQD